MHGRGCVGFVGWRGLVGKAFIKQIVTNTSINIGCARYLFLSSTSMVLVSFIKGIYNVRKANDVKTLLRCRFIVSIQGSGYTSSSLLSLRTLNWIGYWIDASSSLRRLFNVCVVLDPVNPRTIKEAIERSRKSFVGGNCTVSLMLMVLHKLIRRSKVCWMFVTTFQSASGAGSSYIKNLLLQMVSLSRFRSRDVLDSRAQFRVTDPNVCDSIAGSVVPWIDGETNRLGTSKEEQKGFIETNRLLGLPMNLHVGGVCIRIGVLRSHSQSILIKSERDMCFGCIADVIQTTSRWVKLLPNRKPYSRLLLTPDHISGSLVVAIGRLKIMPFNRGVLSMFTVGDQLLWGAATPIVRIYRLLRRICSY